MALLSSPATRSRWDGRTRVSWWPPHCICPGIPHSICHLSPGPGGIHLERLNALRGHSWFPHELACGLTHVTSFCWTSVSHQVNGAVIPVLRWKDLVRCPVLNLQVCLSYRLLAPYPTPSPKSHPSHIQQNPKWTGVTSCPRMLTADSVIPHFDFLSKLPKQAGSHHPTWMALSYTPTSLLQ